MEYYNKMLCLSLADLTGGGDPVISMNTLNMNVYRGNIIRAHRAGGEGSRALYVWSSIPEKYRKRYMELHGDPEEEMRKAQQAVELVEDSDARSYFEAYRYTDKRGEERSLTDEQIDDYTRNASVLNVLRKTAQGSRSLRSSLNARGTGNTWDIVAETSESLRERYGHSLPANPARLRAKMRDYAGRGYEVLISGKLGNTSSVKITEEFGELIIALKRSRVPVYTDRALLEKANEEAEKRGWKPLRSLAGLKRWLNSPAVQPLWYDAAYGEQTARQRFARKHRTALPSRRDSLWYGDGTKLNLYYRDEKGNVRTTCVYEVVDAMSEVLLGYHISDSEDYEAQYNAFRMAVQTSRHKPYEIVHDNQGGHKKLERLTDGFFHKICTVHRPTQPYNGESKTIESIFGRFQSQVLSKLWQFTGQNVTAKKLSSRPNVEFQDANKARLYTLDELRDAYAAARKEWNEMPHPATGERRIDMYMRSVNEATPEVTTGEMVRMFWVFKERRSTFTDQGIKVRINGTDLQYEVFSAPGVPDHGWRRLHTYEKFVVAYDPNDTSCIRLYTRMPDGSLRFERTAEPYIVIHRAKQEQTDADGAFIRQEQEANVRDRVERAAEGYRIASAHGTAPEQNGLRTPKLKGLPKTAQDALYKRYLKYDSDNNDLELGRHTKSMSMDDWRDVMGLDADKEKGKRTAGKL